jgi:N-methylhydantoinase A
MSDLIRRQIVKSGYLPEEFVLYAFGGAGPVHAAGFARELGIGEIYVFPTSPVFSAFGAATADIIHSRVVTYQGAMPIDPRALNERLDAIEQELLALMSSENFPREQVTFRRFVSMRFRRQTYGVEMPLPWQRLDPARVTELGRLFEAKYEELYGEGAGFSEAGMEINTLRVDAVGTVPKPTLTSEPATAVDTSRALKGRRAAYFGGRFVETAIYDYERMAVGTPVSGPAIVEAPLTTIVVPPEYAASVDGYHNVIISSDPTRARG